MKHYLLASCLLLAAACGTKSGDQAATDKPAADKPAAEQSTADKPAAEGKELDLTQYGFPVALRVPEGTTAAKVSSGQRVELTGPKYLVEVTSEPAADEEKAKAMLTTARDAYKMDKGTVVLVDEPTVVYLERTKREGGNGYMWFRSVYDPAAKKIILLTETSNAYSDATLTKADHDSMLESARTARLAGK